MYKFSVIVPIYNVAEYLADCLDSLLNQGLCQNEYEILLLDDESTDESLSIARDYARRNENMRVLNHANRGLSFTRNRGIDEAEGEYLIFVDSDDLLAENTLQYVYSVCKREDLDAYFFDAQVLDPESSGKKGRFLNSRYNRRKNFGKFDSGTELYFELTKANRLVVNVMFYALKRTVLTHHHLTFIEGLIHEDEVFTLQLMPFLKKVMHENRFFYLKRIRAHSIITGTESLKHIEHLTQVFAHLEEQLKATNDSLQMLVLKFKMSQIVRHISSYYCKMRTIHPSSDQIKLLNEKLKAYSHFDLKTKLFWQMTTDKFTHWITYLGRGFV